MPQVKRITAHATLLCTCVLVLTFVSTATYVSAYLVKRITSTCPAVNTKSSTKSCISQGFARLYIRGKKVFMSMLSNHWRDLRFRARPTFEPISMPCSSFCVSICTFVRVQASKPSQYLYFCSSKASTLVILMPCSSVCVRVCALVLVKQVN